MTMIPLTAPDGPIDAMLETPEGSGPWPGVVVLHDGIGLSEDVRDTCRRLAANGYLAVAPNLYARGGARCVPAVMREVISTGGGRATRDILAARDHLVADGDCTSKVAVVGFCLGGGFVLLVAPKGFDAAAPFCVSPAWGTTRRPPRTPGSAYSPSSTHI
ncbi:dienelactone hydrolase [Nocardia sp. GAS34]